MGCGARQPRRSGYLYDLVLASTERRYGRQHDNYLLRAQEGATVAPLLGDHGKSWAIDEHVLDARKQMDVDGVQTLQTVQVWQFCFGAKETWSELSKCKSGHYIATKT